jgi:hypothetical protein
MVGESQDLGRISPWVMVIPLKARFKQNHERNGTKVNGFSSFFFPFPQICDVSGVATIQNII